MKVRPSPSESATLFAVGTRKRGNDGRMYVVAETKNGVRRWSPDEHNNKTSKSKVAGL